MASQPPACAIVIVVVDFEFQYGANTSEAVEHRGNERPVPAPLEDCRRVLSSTYVSLANALRQQVKGSSNTLADKR